MRTKNECGYAVKVKKKSPYISVLKKHNIKIYIFQNILFCQKIKLKAYHPYFFPPFIIINDFRSQYKWIISD